MSGELDRIMALRGGSLVSRDIVSRICPDCGDKMAKKGMVAVRADVLKVAIRDGMVRQAVKSK